MKFLTVLVVAMLSLAGNAIAADGDLIVNGTLSVGSGGVKYPDGSIQTTAKTLVWDYTVVGSAVTAITSPALDSNAHGGYEVQFIIYNSTVSFVTYSLYYNNDQIAKNYRYSMNGLGTQNATIYNLNFGREVRIDGTIDVSPRGYVNFMGLGVDDFYCTQSFLTHLKIVTIANLTRIDVVSSVANGIGVGSRFRIWRRI